ncbi:MAG: hypothetical protein R2715_15035 [Ilumatobacteraceae bacterium]
MSEADVLHWMGDPVAWMADYLADLPVDELDTEQKAIAAVRRSVPFIGQLEREVRSEVLDDAIVTAWAQMRSKR